MSLFSKIKNYVSAKDLLLPGSTYLTKTLYSDPQKQAQQNALEQIRAQNKANLKAWNMQNEYNNPTSQMERLQEAGLNPNLVYSSGNVTGNTTSAPSLTAEYAGINEAQAEAQGLQTYFRIMSAVGGSAFGSYIKYKTLENMKDSLDLRSKQIGLESKRVENQTNDISSKIKTRDDQIENGLINSAIKAVASFLPFLRKK